MRTRLLLVDDEVHSRSMLAACLSRQGYDTAEAGDAAEMRRAIADQPVDLILLDINLPDVDGLTLVREVRLQSQIGIILLTARDGEMDRVAGLEWGADDYVTKQTPLAELIARIRAVLRRTGQGIFTMPAVSAGGQGGENVEPSALVSPPPAPESGETAVFGGWRLEIDNGRLTTPTGGQVALTKSETDLLGLLARRLGKTVTRSELMTSLFNREWSGAERSVDVTISRLRRKLGDDPRYPKRLLTMRGAGYMLKE